MDLIVVDLEDWHLRQLGRTDLADGVMNDFAFAALMDGRAIAAGGIVNVLWPGVGYCWFIKHQVPFGAWPGITRAVAKAVEIALENDYHRVEMLVDAHDDDAISWAERLGFTREGLCRQVFSNRGDGWLYGRTRQTAD